MFSYKLGFDQPWFLLLLLLIPVLWAFSYRSLASLGQIRRVLALSFRTFVLTLCVLALAGVQLLRTSDKVTVIYLLDQSASIPPAKRQMMLQYVVKEVAKHRNADREDRAGVIVFGKDAVVEVPPFDFNIPSVGVLESTRDLRIDATNLTAALKLAQASFPEDSAKRIVVVTDGNENIGNARAVVPLLSEHGIGIDVVPIEMESLGEVVLDKVTLPPDIRLGQPIEARVVVNNYSPGQVAGKLRVVRQVGPTEQLLREIQVSLSPGTNVYSFEHEIEQPAVYTYRANFVADDPGDDAMVENNEATAFTHVRGRGRVLLIEDWAHRGDFDFLIQRLRANDVEVTVQGSDELFTSLAELQAYDAVILANVPRSSGEDSRTVTNFTDAQIQMLVRNTEQMGSGLIMLGGPDTFGAGGWANTELEKAMPVDFQIKNTKVEAVGALVLMMHASEMAQGNYWQKVVGVEAIKALGPMDYCGLIHWNNMTGKDAWLWGAPQGLVRVSGRRRSMMARLNRMTPGDMPQFENAMKMSLAAFSRVKASVKHMIVISDGDPSPPRASTVASFRKGKIQVTTVAVGSHGQAGSQRLQNLATQTGGKYYVVTNPKALPRIYQREARRVARPLVYEPDGGVAPEVVYDHEMHSSIQVGEKLPTIKGFVLTTVKDNPLVEVSIRSPQPVGKENSTILASWTYGLGRTAVLTTDAGNRWADTWTSWEQYDKFFTQLVRWSMRPVDDSGKFSVATDIKDGKVRVVITALDKDDEFLNFLNMSASAIGPELEPFDLKIEQTAPGRYVGQFEADASGSYFVTISPGKMTDPLTGKSRMRPPIITGVNVPYSAEYRDRQTNLPLLKSLADSQPQGGNAGVMITGQMKRENMDQLLSVNTFRHDLAQAVSIQDVWPLFLLIAGCVFFADVFIRRVTVSYEWFEPAVVWLEQRILRRQRALQEPDERLERLRSRKAAIADRLDERRAAARFEPQPDAAAPRDLDEVVQDAAATSSDTPPAEARQPTPIMPGESEEDSYTTRLLKAKRKAWDDQDRD